MKKILLSLMLLTALPAMSQTTFSNISSQEVAVVIGRQPKYSTVYQQVCTQVPVERRGIGGTIVGGVLGAAIGNQFGGGSGKDIATAAGAVIGGTIGGQNDSTVEMQTRCTQQPMQIQTGEIVTFEYKGRRFSQVFN